MNSRERIKTIIAGGKPDKCGFWLGNPHPHTWPILHKYFGTTIKEEIRVKLNDDMRWLSPWNVYKHPMEKIVIIKRSNNLSIYSFTRSSLNHRNS